MASYQSLAPAAGNQQLVVRVLDQRLQRRGLGTKPDSEFSNFYTPDNTVFYSGNRYQPLDPARGEIRLIRVFPRKSLKEHAMANPHWPTTLDREVEQLLMSHNMSLDTRVLACELVDKVPMSRVSGTGYCTVSYCAGKPTDVAVMIVDGIPFMAFANLEHAIRNALHSWRQRHLDRDLLLWADQICINQQDYDERASQVGMMRDIYRRCSETFVCLSTPGSTDALGWAKNPRSDGSQASPESRIEAWIDRYFEPLISDQVPWVTMASPKQDPTNKDSQYTYQWVAKRGNSTRAQRKTEVVSPVPTRSALSAVQVFIECPWWQRCWVFQEFISSPKPVFMSHSTSVPWRELDATLKLLSRRDGNFADVVERAASKAELKIQKLQRAGLERASKQDQQTAEALATWQQKKDEELAKAEAYLAKAKKCAEQHREYLQLVSIFEKEYLQEWHQYIQTRAAETRGELDQLQKRISATNPLNLTTKSSLHRKRKDTEHHLDMLMRVSKHNGNDSPNLYGQLEFPPRDRCTCKTLNVCPFWKATKVLARFAPATKPPGLPVIPEFTIGAHPFKFSPFDVDGYFQENPVTLPRRFYTLDQLRSMVLDTHKTHFAASKPKQIPVQKAFLSMMEKTRLHLEKTKSDLLTWQAAFATNPPSQSHSSALSMIEIKRRGTNKRHTDLKALLSHSRHCEASDPRDRIYAFLGLLPKNTFPITPDYTSSNTVVHVLLETAQKIIEQEKTLDILRHVHRGRDGLGTFLPSWVPDWTSRAVMKEEDELWGYISSLGKEKVDPALFNASNGTEITPEFRTHGGDETRVDLKVRGRMVYVLDEDEGDIAGFEGLGKWGLVPGGEGVGVQEGEYAVTLGMASLDDEVWVLEGVKLPVLLRMEGDGSYSCCGEVVLFYPKVALTGPSPPLHP